MDMTKTKKNPRSSVDEELVDEELVDEELVDTSIPTDKFEYHPIAATYPRLSEQVKKALEDDIRINDLKQKIIIHKKKKMIIDGINRYEALLSIDKFDEAKHVEWFPRDGEEDEDTEDGIRSIIKRNNGLRRHMTRVQKAFAAARNTPFGPGRPPDNFSGVGMTVKDASKFFDVRPDAISDAKAIIKQGHDEVLLVAEKEELPLYICRDIVRAPKYEQLRELNNRRKYHKKYEDGGVKVRSKKLILNMDIFKKSIDIIIDLSDGHKDAAQNIFNTLLSITHNQPELFHGLVQLLRKKHDERNSVEKNAIYFTQAGLHVLEGYGYSGFSCACGNGKCKNPGRHPIDDDWHDKLPPDATTIRNTFSLDSSLLTPLGMKHKTITITFNHTKLSSENFDKYCADNNLPETLTIKLLNLEHRIYRVSDFDAPKNTNLENGIRLRGEGSFVSLPPSKYRNKKGDDHYAKVTTDEPLANLPEEYVGHIKEIVKQKKHEAINP
jgi:hypothetical protein